MSLLHIGIENKLYLCLLLVPIVFHLLLYFLRKKVYYVSTLNIFGAVQNNVLRKVEIALFYLVYTLIILFLSQPYKVKKVSKDNVLLVIDNSYTTATKYGDSDRFSSLLKKLRNIAMYVGKDRMYYVNYELGKKSITDNLPLSPKKLNMTLLKSFIETNLKLNNIVIFFTDASGSKIDFIDRFKNNSNFYYYIVGSKSKNYCIARVLYLSKFLQKTRIFIYLENYNIKLPSFLTINGRDKKIRGKVIRITLPFATKFIDVRLPDGDDSYIDNYVKISFTNSNVDIKYKLKEGRNILLDTLRKKIISRGNKKIFITDTDMDGNFCKIIYAGFSPTQKIKKIAFRDILYFDARLFKNINKITFVKNKMMPHFMFLEGIPLLATNTGYLILNEGNKIFTSFGINDDITISKFWHTFLWKRIIEFAANEFNLVKSKVSFFENCDISSQTVESKEFVKEMVNTKYSLQPFIRIILVVLIPLYLMLFILSNFLF